MELLKRPNFFFALESRLGAIYDEELGVKNFSFLGLAMSSYSIRLGSVPSRTFYPLFL